MMIYQDLKAWLFGCRASLADEWDRIYCTLRRRHAGEHEAWTCTCAGNGRCTEPEALVETWPT